MVVIWFYKGSLLDWGEEGDIAGALGIVGRWRWCGLGEVGGS